MFLKNLIIGFCMIMSLTGCGSDTLVTSLKGLFSIQPAKVWLKKVSFSVSDNVNESSPVRVHIVIPYSPELMEKLMKMSAQDYFQQVEQIKLDNVEKIDIFEWELVRRQRLDDEKVEPKKVSGEGVIVFANYSTPGLHRVTVGMASEILVQLQDNDFVVIPKK